MDKFTCIKSFIQVAQSGGFSAAGRKLGLSKMVVSKHISQLEDTLGVRLLNRTTRSVSLTTNGNAYYQRCAPLLEEFEELEAAIKDSHDTPKGLLRMTAPISFAEIHLIPILADFIDRFPELKIDLQLTDRFIDLVEEGMDVALRIGDLPDSSMIARKLAEVDIILCATPEYLRQYPLERPEQIADHRILLDTNYKQAHTWHFHDGRQAIKVPVEGHLQVNSDRAIREMLLRGKGIGLCPSFAVAEELADGRLQRLLPQLSLKGYGVYAVYPHRRHLSTKVRLLVEALHGGLNTLQASQPKLRHRRTVA